ncbi:MAG: nucleotidyl transferase AbiEii/AbiGii toxin family protein [Solirubrobacteraceae bacterium]
MNIELLELAAAELGELVDDVLFVGGATIGLWVTDPAAPPERPTKDVDVVVEVATRAEFHRFEARLRDRGLSPDVGSEVICRWRARSGLILDVMPTDPRVLGFASVWQARAFPHAAERRLPSGATLRAITPPYLVATKTEAFAGRGRGDFLASHDFEDVVRLVDGRSELVDEIDAADAALRGYLAAEVGGWLDAPRLLDGIFGALQGDDVSQTRADTVVLPALRRIAQRG